jgi:hypothetical protein
MLDEKKRAKIEQSTLIQRNLLAKDITTMTHKLDQIGA